MSSVCQICDLLMVFPFDVELNITCSTHFFLSYTTFSYIASFLQPMPSPQSLNDLVKSIYKINMLPINIAYINIISYYVHSMYIIESKSFLFWTFLFLSWKKIGWRAKIFFFNNKKFTDNHCGCVCITDTYWK